MASVYQYKAELAGWDGAPGITLWNAYAGFELVDDGDIQEFGNRIRAFYDGIKSSLVGGMTVDVSPEVKQIEIATGALEEVKVITAPAQVISTVTAGAGNLSRASMICTRLKTDRPWYNRLLQGRQFHGPIPTSAFGNTGEISQTVRNTVQTNYGGLLDIVGPLRLVVWARPREAKPGVEARPGEVGFVQQVVANRVPGTLRSRKV